MKKITAGVVAGTFLLVATVLIIRRPGASFAAPRWSVDARPANGDALRATDSPGSRYVTVRAATITPRLEAYGQVEPITILPVNAAEAGIVAGLNVLPGMRVRAAQELARLSGPEIDAALRQGEADVRSAHAQLSAARNYLAIERQQLPSHLSTRAEVQQAESAVAQAQTNFENAQSHLQTVEQTATLSAPANGTVIALNASSGELVGAGQAVVTLQTTGRLWLQAAYYGTDMSMIRVGMTGTFAPADGGPPVRVRVRTVSAAMTAGEGEAVALTPTVPSTHWISGEFGAVTLDLPPRSLVAVPTQSLILDQGKWWVLVHTDAGDRPQEVVPGPARGWETFLESGVTPGAQVVVEDAYLLFHRGISKSYRPPDQ